MSNPYQQEFIQKLERCTLLCACYVAQNLGQDPSRVTGTGIHMALDCASVCKAMAEELTLEDIITLHLCQVCAFICNSCGEELERLDGMGIAYCSECSKACYQCAQTCQQILSRPDSIIEEQPIQT
ncbi:hypothetical protein DIU36_02195 [Mucilaginibacter rubeus]|nr:hypothetical protein DIU36_02195 [Mucilaginibacter rubeus]